MNVPQQATLKFRYTAGALIRGEVERKLRNLAFDYGVKIDIQIYSGLLESDYHVIIKGNVDTLMVLNDVIHNYLSSIDANIGEWL